MNDHSKDSYHPSDSGVHSKLCVRGAVGSIVDGRSLGGFSLLLAAIRVKMVCNGNVGSQLSIWAC